MHVRMLQMLEQCWANDGVHNMHGRLTVKRKLHVRMVDALRARARIHLGLLWMRKKSEINEYIHKYM